MTSFTKPEVHNVLHCRQRTGHSHRQHAAIPSFLANASQSCPSRPPLSILAELFTQPGTSRSSTLVGGGMIALHNTGPWFTAIVINQHSVNQQICNESVNFTLLDINVWTNSFINITADAAIDATAVISPCRSNVVAACWYRSSSVVVLSVCLSVNSRKKTASSIEMPFGVMGRWIKETMY